MSLNAASVGLLRAAGCHTSEVWWRQRYRLRSQAAHWWSSSLGPSARRALASPGLVLPLYTWTTDNTIMKLIIHSVGILLQKSSYVTVFFSILTQNAILRLDWHNIGTTLHYWDKNSLWPHMQILKKGKMMSETGVWPRWESILEREAMPVQ